MKIDKDICMGGCLVLGTLYSLITKDYTALGICLAVIALDILIAGFTGSEYKEACNRSTIVKHADKNRMFKEQHIDEVVSYLCRDKHTAKALLKDLEESQYDIEYYPEEDIVEEEEVQDTTELLNQFAKETSKEIVKENISINNSNNTETQESNVNRYLVDLSGDDIKLRDFKSKQVIRSIAYDDTKEIATEEDANIVIQPDDAFGYVVNKDRVTVIYLGIAEEDFALEYNINDKQAVENLI